MEFLFQEVYSKRVSLRNTLLHIVCDHSEELSGNAISSDMQGPVLKLVYHHGQYFLPVVAICGPFWDYLWLNDVISGGAFCWLALLAGLSFLETGCS